MLDGAPCTREPLDSWVQLAQRDDSEATLAIELGRTGVRLCVELLKRVLRNDFFDKATPAPQPLRLGTHGEMAEATMSSRAKLESGAENC